MKIQRILCPTDFSVNTDEALRYAVALARAYEAELFVFHCLPSSNAESGVSPDQKRIGSLKNAETRLDDSVKKNLAQAGGNSLRWQAIVRDRDDPGDAIAQEAAKNNVDLIVMRSRRRPHRAALLGSTAEQICRTAACPVLVTHSNERDWIDQRSDIRLKRVLIAYDFSDYSELALHYALSFAQEYQAELHMLHVLPPFSLNEPELSWYPLGQEGAYHQAARRLQKAVPPEAHLWCKVRNIVTEGHPYREILSYAEANQIDLICLGAHGAGFGMRALFGSNVDRVLRQAPCPVFVARPLKPGTSNELLRSKTIVQLSRH